MLDMYFLADECKHFVCNNMNKDFFLSFFLSFLSTRTSDVTSGKEDVRPSSPHATKITPQRTVI